MSQDLWSIESGSGLGELTLGSPRAEVSRRLAERGVEVEDDGAEWLYVDDLDLELRFDVEGADDLVEIVASDERVTLEGAPVLGQRAPAIVDRLRVSDSMTLWTSDEEGNPEASRVRFDVLEEPLDEDLLRNGTLWIPARGLGFTLWYGEVSSVRVRPPSDSPKLGRGPLTESQRILFRKENLNDALSTSSVASARPAASWFQRLWTLALLATLGLIVWKAIDHQQRWNNAIVAEGEVIAVRPPAPDPFPSEFDVAYRDEEGNPRRTTFLRADVYTLGAVGEKIEVRYLPGAPDRPMGPARYRDAAFLDYMPLGISAFAIYLIVQIVAWIVDSAMRRLTAPEPLKTSLGSEYDAGR